MSEVKKIKINGTDISIKDETARTGITENSKAIAAEAEARKNADTNYTGDNRTSTVEGDDTRTAGDITDTADNIVIHAKASILMDSDGSYTEDIEGKKKIDADSIEETYQKTRSIHVVGQQTEAIDSSATKSIDGTYSKIVTGAVTETYKDSLNVTAKNSTETVTEKKTIKAADIALDPTSGALTYSEPVKNNKLVTVPMKSTTGEAYNLLCEGSELGTNSIKSVKDFGAIGDGVHDDTEAIKAALNANTGIYFPAGIYLISETLVFFGNALYGAGSERSEIKMKAGISDPIIRPGGLACIQNMGFTFTDDPTNCGAGKYIAIQTDGLPWPLQRTAIRNLNIHNVGTGIATGTTEADFSIHFDSIQIKEFGFAAIHQRYSGSSGNHYDNIYITSPLGDFQAYGVYLEAWCNNHVFTNLNIEWGKYKVGFWANDISNVVINSVTFERCVWPEISGLIKLGCNAQIQNITFLYNQFETTPNTKCLIELLSAHTNYEGTESGLPEPYSVHIGSFNVIGLNNEHGGVQNLDVYLFGKYDRKADQFGIEVDNLYILSYNNDAAYLRNRNVFQYIYQSAITRRLGNTPLIGTSLPSVVKGENELFYNTTDSKLYFSTNEHWYPVTG